jgi:hypothetical protein
MTAADPLARIAELPGVAAAVESARAAVDQLLGHQAMRRRSAEVSAEAGLRCARASAALDGENVGLDELRGGQAGVVARGALRVSAELGPLVSTWERAPLQALARLHVLAAADALRPEELGRPRVSPGVSARLAALAELVTRSTAPAIVVAAVTHGELLAVTPFEWGSGLVARAAGRLVLVATGLDPKAVTAPDVGHARDPERYAEAAAAYASGDVGDWVRHVADAISFGATEGLAIANALSR